MTDADISSFVDITGTSAPVARGFLELANEDVQQAIQLFFENPELQHSLNSGAPPAGPSAGAAPSRRQRGVREDDQGVIHIDSDDDDGDDDDGEDVEMIAREAQMEDDAAMARRLFQNDADSAGPGAAEDVRSPIQGTTDTLVGGGGGGGWPGAMPIHDDPFERAEYERVLNQPGRPRSLPMLSHTSWAAC